MAEHNNSSSDWLPPGWTMELKLRKYGRKDKCYVDPSREHKFNSKPEVIRYLNSLQINHPVAQEENKDSFDPEPPENKDSGKRSGKNIVIEKSIAEGLPPGWIKEVRVTKRGRTIRKDPYYTDPVSGFVFRSLKDIDRYLKTGELGKDAFKRKDKGHINVELGDEKLSSHAVAQGQRQACSGEKEQLIVNQCSKLVETEMDEEILDPTDTDDHRKKPAGSGEKEQLIENQCSKLVETVKDEEILDPTDTENHICMSLAHDSDQCIDNDALSSIGPPQTKSLEQREGGGESNLDVIISAPVVGASPEKLLDNGVESQEKVSPKINKSVRKRTRELPRRASKRLAGIEVDPALEVKTNSRARRVTASQFSEAETSSSENSRNLATPEVHAGKLELDPKEHSGKVELGSTAGEKQMLPILPPASLPISEERSGDEGFANIAANMADMKPASPLNMSLTDLWTDPCIEFAVKTLTGEIPVVVENTGNENPVSSIDLSFEELWSDPCIEFAVKTLTGAIPVGDDLGIQNCFQHVSSSDTLGVNDIMPLNVENFCRSEYISQQAPVASKLTHPGDASFPNGSGSGLHQDVEGGRSSDQLRK